MKEKEKVEGEKMKMVKRRKRKKKRIGKEIVRNEKGGTKRKLKNIIVDDLKE